MKKVFFILCFAASVSGRGAERLVTLATVKSRPLAMGGAFVSMNGQLDALDFNPAGFRLGFSGRPKHWTVFLNPAGPVLAAAERDACSDWTVPAGLILRGFGVAISRLRAGVILGEESLSDESRLSRDRFWDCTDYELRRNAGFGFSFDLAPKVSIGASGEIFMRGQSWGSAKAGYRYGMMLRPRGNISVGLCYVDFPKACPWDRLALERLSDETLNVGVSYRPAPWLDLALDIRNVSDEDKPAVREPHIGMEARPWPFFSLRAGYYRTRHASEQTLTAGFGLGFDLSETFPFNAAGSVRTDISLCMAWQRQVSAQHRWFFLTWILQIG
ncbi:hypothetical protein JW906_07930 [bacterium]|nr:hypothetical protein [bacterium]